MGSRTLLVWGGVGLCLSALWKVVVLISSDCNLHWLHLLATYPDVEGYPVSSWFGRCMAYYFDPSESNSCVTHVNEYRMGEAPKTQLWPDITWPFTIRVAFNSTSGVTKKILLEHFQGEFQNQFTSCEDEAPLTPLGPESIPCKHINFTEMVARLDPVHPLTEPWQVFNKVLSRKDIEREEQMLATGFGTDKSIASLHQHSAIWPHIVVVVSRDEASVGYYHSHPDYFVVWNIAGVKEWHLLPPTYLPRAQVVWSGLTFIATEFLKTHCVVTTKQTPGDILVVPTWWLHKVKLHDAGVDSSNIGHLGYSQHFSPKSSIVGHLVHIVEELFGPAWGTAVSLAPSTAFVKSVATSKGLR